jgi:hypothetical protein
VVVVVDEGATGELSARAAGVLGLIRAGTAPWTGRFTSLQCRPVAGARLEPRRLFALRPRSVAYVQSPGRVGARERTYTRVRISAGASRCASLSVRSCI